MSKRTSGHFMDDKSTTKDALEKNVRTYYIFDEGKFSAIIYLYCQIIHLIFPGLNF